MSEKNDSHLAKNTEQIVSETQQQSSNQRNKNGMTRRSFLKALGSFWGLSAIGKSPVESLLHHQQTPQEAVSPPEPQFTEYTEGGWNRIKILNGFKEIDDLNQEWDLTKLPDELRQQLKASWQEQGWADEQNFDRKLIQVINDFYAIREQGKEVARFSRQSLHQQDLGLFSFFEEYYKMGVMLERVMDGQEVYRDHINTATEHLNYLAWHRFTDP